MSISKIKFDSSAKQLVDSLALSPRAEQVLLSKAKRTEGPLSLQDVQSLLLAAMPDQVETIANAKAPSAGSSYHCDGRVGSFTTQLASLRIEKEVAVVHRRPQPTRPRVLRDPLKGRALLDRDGAFFAICNGANVRDGKAPIMKMIMRENAPNYGCLDLAGSGLAWEQREDESDVVKVGDKDIDVSFEDTDEHQFELGDGAFIVTFDKNGKEIFDKDGEPTRTGIATPENTLTVVEYHPSRTDRNQPDLTREARRNQPQRGTQLDSPNNQPMTGRHVHTDNDRVQIHMFAKDDFPQGAWTSANSSSIEMSLVSEGGLHHEIGSSVSVRYLNTQVNTQVTEAEDKWMMKGNKPSAAAVDLGRYASRSLEQLLNDQVSIISQTKPTDQNTTTVAAKDIIYASAVEHVKLGGLAFEPVSSQVIKADKFGEAGIKVSATEVERNKLQMHLQLDAGFLTSKAPASVEGWRFDIGYRDHENNWQGCESIVNANSRKSGQIKLDLPVVEDAKQAFLQNKQIEIQVFNDAGIPAMRVTVPFSEVDWK